MNELLLVVAGIFVLSFLIGVNKGLIRIVASLFTTLFILVLVVFATPYVSTLLVKYTPMETALQRKCDDLLNSEEVDVTTRDAQINLIEHSELPDFFKGLLLENNNNEVYESLGVFTFKEYVSAYMVQLFSKILAFLLTFLVATVVIRVGLYIFGVIGDLPLIGGVNRLAGGVIGAGAGLIVVWILFILITVFYDFSISKLFLLNIEENEFLKILYDNNVLMNLLLKFRG